MTELPTTRAGRLSVWVAPVIPGVLISTGLVVALVGDGLWDVLAWTLLACTLGYACIATSTRCS